MNLKTVRDVDVKDKVVMVRADYNVPIEDGKITSDLRIKASLETLEYLRQAGAKKIIIISHLGRPEGVDKKLSLKPVAAALDKMVGKVTFVPEVFGPEVEKAAAGLGEGGILVLENLRFYPEEKANSEEFIEKIIKSTGAEIFVQDGFAVVHRAHASVEAVAKVLPVYAGLLLEKEITTLEKVTKDPVRPVLLIIGGAKVEDKKPLIEKFAKGLADQIVVGGKIAADGYPTSDKIYVAEDFDEDSTGAKLDIGPVATSKVAEYIMKAKTILWNGLMGKAEDPAYATSSTIIADLMGENADAETIICGGDTTGFVENLAETNPNLKYSLVSTGGGAALEFLLGNKLPGLEIIEKI